MIFGFIGLGEVGSAYAIGLAQGGAEVKGYDIMLEKAENSFACFKEKILNKSLDFEAAGRLLYDIVSLANEQNVNSEQALYIFNKNSIKNMLNK